MNTDDKEDSITLGLLGAIEEKSDVTQRHLADRLGVALGLANSYLKRCVRKGLVKMHGAPANRYFYYLTPKGFAEKSRLTARYLSISFDFYRQAGDSLTSVYNVCGARDQYRVLFCGMSELAEIALLRAQEHEHDIQIVGTYDPSADKKVFLQLPVWPSLTDTAQFDICILTALNDTENLLSSLNRQLDKEKILIPSILGKHHLPQL